MTEQQIVHRQAAARWIEAKRRLEAKDHTGAELAKLVGEYRRAALAVLEASVPIGLAQLDEESQQQESAA